ncbi:ankyrin repeat domain-containing protein 1 [Elysia marginata]|uniref:Ankyrin repeat domain-containing protein 1 n=1 Tax=Elysia marginata TaxID=1093978 RepID=A0AAV4HH42_9GAST|nr:ankyrin repeat domain-containing protein 1 [Elysia marginata]
MAGERRSGAMYFAVINNDPARLAELVREGGDVDQFYDDVTNISSKSLLHVCCGRGHVTCLRILIENGATLDVRDDWGQTPLMYSITIQFPEAAQVLLEADPDLIHCQDRFGKSPLHCAVATGSDELVRLLLQFEADVNVRCHEGLTPLMYCCMADPEGSKIAVSSGNLRAVERLVSAGADLDGIDKTLRTPLTLAIVCGVKGTLLSDVFAQIISVLVSAGAKLDITANESCNPLMTSALLKSETLVRYFLSLGADPDVKFYSGVTPALVCASTGDLSTLRPLVHSNCCLTTRGNVYKRRRRLELVLDAFELAYTEGYLPLCQLMVEAGYCVYRLRDVFLRDLHRQTRSNLELEEEGAEHQQLQQQSPQHAALAVATSGQASDANTFQSLTFQHAQRLPEDWLNILLWLITKASNPRSLKQEAVFVIRATVNLNGHRLLDCVDYLPLPTLVKKYILLENLNLSDSSGENRSLLGK